MSKKKHRYLSDQDLIVLIKEFYRLGYRPKKIFQWLARVQNKNKERYYDSFSLESPFPCSVEDLFGDDIISPTSGTLTAEAHLTKFDFAREYIFNKYSLIQRTHYQVRALKAKKEI